MRKNLLEFQLSSDGGLPISDLFRKYSIRRNLGKLSDNSPVNLQFITSCSLTPEKMIELFDQIVLTPNESLVIRAMQTIEPSLEKIASVNGRYQDMRDGFIVRFANSNQRVPIGSMGDRIWRILGLALGIVNAQNGI